MDTQLRLITPATPAGAPRRRPEGRPVRPRLSPETRRIGKAGVAAARAELERAAAAQAETDPLRRAS